jgi:hypothetical protein
VVTPDTNPPDEMVAWLLLMLHVPPDTVLVKAIG